MFSKSKINEPAPKASETAKPAAPAAPVEAPQAAEEPVAARGSNRTLGTYLNGKFTVSDLARWLQALPAKKPGLPGLVHLCLPGRRGSLASGSL